jgi:hypothetical protein
MAPTDVWANDLSNEVDASCQTHDRQSRGLRTTSAARVLRSAFVVSFTWYVLFRR